MTMDQDPDCTIIDIRSSQSSMLYKALRNTTNSHNDPVVIDEDDIDCVIIDDNNDPENNQNRHLKNSQRRKTQSNISSSKLEESEKQSCNEIINIHDGPDDSLIVLDEDSDHENGSSITKINKQFENHCVLNFDEIYRKDKVVAELLEKCLDVENSSVMLRIINRSLVPVYNDTSEEFKKSPAFERLLTKTFQRLELDPGRKFAHLKDFCEAMKASIPVPGVTVDTRLHLSTRVNAAKRVQLTTLKRGLNGHTNSNGSDEIEKKRSKVDVIELDDDCDDDNDVIILKDSTDSNKQTVTTIELTSNDIIATIDNSSPRQISNNNKVNLTSINSASVATNDELSFIRSKQINDLNHLPQFPCEIDIYNEEQVNNIAQYIYNNTTTAPTTDNLLVKNRIYNLERDIADYKLKIDNLDNQEVDWDSNESSSPYLLSEYYKTKVVGLYKELCRLVGAEPVKRHKVRLKAGEGRHEGPVRHLERFINDNIDRHGNPPFPDMTDVVNCVRRARDEYGLPWNNKRIHEEARALFVYFGQSVQKQRQKREWRHLMRYVKSEVDDPADNDPALLATLQQNAKLGSMNEKNLLDKYAEMESAGLGPVTENGIRQLESENEDDVSVNSTNPKQTSSNTANEYNNTTNINNDNRKNSETSVQNEITNHNNVENNTEHINRSLTTGNSENISFGKIVDVRNIVNFNEILNQSKNHETRSDSISVNNNLTGLNETVQDNYQQNNKTISTFTNNVIVADSPICFQQIAIPPQVANYPIKYVVVDENSQAVGVIVLPTLNPGARNVGDDSIHKEPNIVEDTVEIRDRNDIALPLKNFQTFDDGNKSINETKEPDTVENIAVKTEEENIEIDATPDVLMSPSQNASDIEEEENKSGLIPVTADFITSNLNEQNSKMFDDSDESINNNKSKELNRFENTVVKTKEENPNPNLEIERKPEILMLHKQLMFENEEENNDFTVPKTITTDFVTSNLNEQNSETLDDDDESINNNKAEEHNRVENTVVKTEKEIPSQNLEIDTKLNIEISMLHKELIFENEEENSDPIVAKPITTAFVTSNLKEQNSETENIVNTEKSEIIQSMQVSTSADTNASFDVSVNNFNITVSDASGSQEEFICDTINNTETKTIQDNTCQLNYETGDDNNHVNDIDIKNTSEFDKTTELLDNVNKVNSGELVNEDKNSGMNDADMCNDNLKKVVVKREKLDIPKMLEALGDNYSVTVLNIQDPFEIIEISDSSDSEDEL